MTTKTVFSQLQSILEDLKLGYYSVAETQARLTALQAKATGLGLILTVPSKEELKAMDGIEYESSDPDQGSSY